MSVMNEITNWFQSNLLTLNCNKTHFLQFLTKNKKKEIQIQIMSSNSLISNLKNTHFLCLTIDSALSWKDHMAELSTKLSKACYAIRTIKPFMTFNVLRTVYFSYFHSLLSYGIIFWGNSHLTANIFKIQKRIIRITTNKGKRYSCRQLFKTLQILTVPSQYTGCFKKSFTTLKVYRNLYRGHTQRFELSKCSKTHRVLPRDSYGSM